MIVIADSGSTKTDWLVFSDEGIYTRFQTPGLNPYFIDTNEISHLIQGWISPFLIRGQVSAIYFYGAGCQGNTIMLMEDVLKSVFSQSSIVEVKGDLLGAAKALLGNAPGFAAILGTGSNSCIYNGHQITTQIDSLGFLLGDEGSGAFIGKRIISDFLRGKMSNELENFFLVNYGMDQDELLDQVYRSPHANRFCASFAKFLDIPSMDLSYRYEVISSSFHAFFQEIVCHYPAYDQFKFNAVGSIAFHFKDILTDVASSYGMEIGKVIPSVIDELAAYHDFNPSNRW